MRFQLLSTGQEMLGRPVPESNGTSIEVQVSGDTLVVSPPDSSPDVPTAIVSYLDLTPLQIAAIQAQIAVQRSQVQSLMQQLTNNRRELIATTLKGQFDIRQVRKLAAQQAASWSHLSSRTPACRPKSTRSSRSSNRESLMK